MVYHTFVGQFQPSFSISGPGDGFKNRYAFLIKVLVQVEIQIAIITVHTVKF